MADPRQRRSPRVAYSAPVRLSGEWSDREPWFVPLLAQSLDMSEGGMALVTPLHLRLGAAVTCSMRLGGQQAYFVGRVVWDRLAPDGTKRVGIEFQSPSDQETGLMRRLLAIGQSHPHRVNLRFDGRPDTMTALARVTNSGLALSAPLPILRRDTAVRFAFEGIGPTFEGRVDRVRLAHLQGMPALRVAIRVNQAQQTSAEPRAANDPASHAREDATPTAVEVPITARVPAASRGRRSRMTRLRAHVRRGLRELPLPAWLALWLCALAAGALGHSAWLDWSEAPIATATTAYPRASRAKRAPVPIAPAEIAPAKTAVSTEPKARLQPAEPIAEPSPAPALAPPPAPDKRFQPTFKWRRERRELFVPLVGPFDAVRHYRLRNPDGIAIDVPHAHGDASRQRYPVRRPGVSRVDVSPWGSGSRVRVWVHQPFDDYRLEAKAHGLRIVLPVER